jgi:hypothetical protein
METMATPLAAGILTALLAAPQAPAEHGGRWVEIESPAFTVFSDAGVEEALQTLVRFQKVQAALAPALPAPHPSGERDLWIVAARDEASLRVLAPGWWQAGEDHHPSSLHLTGRDHELILLRTDLHDDEGYHAAYRGFASHLLGLESPGVPPWARRGLADFYGRIAVGEDGALVGRTAVTHIRTLRRSGLLPLRELLAAGPAAAESLDAEGLRRFDAQSWALVHYLTLGEEGTRQAELARFLDLVGQGREAGPAAREAFGEAEDLDEVLRRYVHRQTFATRTIPDPPAPGLGAAPARSLSAAEGWTLRGAIHLVGDRLPEARACIGEALRLDAGLAWAHEVRAGIAWAEDDPPATREAAERSLALEPDRRVASLLRERAAGPPTVNGAEHLCQRGDLDSCALLGGWLLDGEGVAPDVSRGAALLEEACHGGLARTCLELGWRYREGRGVAADLAASARMLEAACTRGEATGCVALAWALQNGDGVPRDVLRAAALYEDTCQAGEGSCCTRLGLLLLAGDEIPPDRGRARELLERGCRLGDATGCSSLESWNEAAPARVSPPRP